MHVVYRSEPVSGTTDSIVEPQKQHWNWPAIVVHFVSVLRIEIIVQFPIIGCEVAAPETGQRTGTALRTRSAIFRNAGFNNDYRNKRQLRRAPADH